MADMRIPNADKSDHRNGTDPLGGSKGAISGPNQSDPGDRRGGTNPLGGGAPTIQPPNKRFSVGHSSQR